MFDTHYILVRYTQGGTPQTDGDIVRARVGFHGLVTYHLALLGLVGWSASFYRPHDGSLEARQFDSVTAQTEARWFLQSRPNLDAASATTGLSSVAVATCARSTTATTARSIRVTAAICSSACSF